MHIRDLIEALQQKLAAGLPPDTPVVISYDSGVCFREISAARFLDNGTEGKVLALGEGWDMEDEEV